MKIEFFKRSTEPGYGKFGDIGRHMFNIIWTAKNTKRSDLNIVFMFHPKNEYVEGIGMDKSIQTIGKMLDDKFNIEQIFAMILYTNTEYSPVDKKTNYSFVTSKTDKIPAKTPKGMFEKQEIDNNLQVVIDTARKYYSTTTK